MIIKWSYRLTLVSLMAVPVALPLFWLPLTTDFYQFNKLVLFYILTGLALIGWLIYSITSKTVRLTLSPPLLPWLLLAAAAATATWFNPPPTPELWLSSAGIYLVGFIYFLLTTTIIQNAPQVKTVLMLTSLSLGLAAIGGVVNFNPVGPGLGLVSLLLAWLPASLVLAVKIRSGVRKIAYFLLSGIMVSSLILNGYKLLPGQELTPVLLPKLTGWSIAVDTLKTKLFFGTGPGRFIESFTQFKPLNLNQGNLWNIGFTTSANLYLEVLTTMGLVGLAVFIWLLGSANRLRRRQPGTRITASQLALVLSLGSQLIIGLVIPFTIINWVFLVFTLSLLVAAQKSKQSPQVKDVLLSLTAVSLVEPWEQSPKSSPLLPWLIALPAVLGLAIVGFSLSKIYAADYYFKQSLDAAAQNQGKETYDLQIKAISLAPAVDRYRLSYSNTNLALANSLASSSDLSDQDRQTIATLIQQSIREARLATQINPRRAGNWANLANIYKTLVNFADGADQFAQAAYVRAVQLDPGNPSLRLDLGGLFYSLKQYDLAEDRFKEAVQLKPNLPNAYYNLSYVYQ
ncbi:MAG: tetratricopeptide repeat protein, partial [Patescibacteria group bacterium]|nr:tetratricopeptide repeat protein [Patescibacteria group bacterium]